MSKVIIVGGGASGLMCALNSKTNLNEVTIRERNSIPGKKILMSGNGRCNFYNDDQDINRYHSESDKINYLLAESNRVLDVFNSLGVKYSVKNGYYYPYSNKSETINNTLINECYKKDIEIRCNYEVTSIKKENNKFIINDDLTCDILVLSMGSISGINVDKFYGYDILNDLGLNIVRPLPSLTKLVCEGSFFNKWNGIRTKAIVSSFNNDTLLKEESGEILLTDYGVSGICVFNISRYASIALNKKDDVYVCINFVPSISNIYTYLNNTNNTINIVLKRMINDKLANVILGNIDILRNKTFRELTEDEKVILINELTNFKLYVTGTMNYNQSQVTRGGVDLSNINTSFESNKVPGLYFIGEVLDVDGDCGGYNIAFAIYSALIASRGINND